MPQRRSPTRRSFRPEGGHPSDRCRPPFRRPPASGRLRIGKGGRLHPGRVAAFTSESLAGFARNTHAYARKPVVGLSGLMAEFSSLLRLLLFLGNLCRAAGRGQPSHLPRARLAVPTSRPSGGRRLGVRTARHRPRRGGLASPWKTGTSGVSPMPATALCGGRSRDRHPPTDTNTGRAAPRAKPSAHAGSRNKRRRRPRNRPGVYRGPPARPGNHRSPPLHLSSLRQTEMDQ